MSDITLSKFYWYPHLVDDISAVVHKHVQDPASGVHEYSLTRIRRDDDYFAAQFDMGTRGVVDITVQRRKDLSCT